MHGWDNKPSQDDELHRAGKRIYLHNLDGSAWNDQMRGIFAVADAPWVPGTTCGRKGIAKMS